MCVFIIYYIRKSPNSLLILDFLCFYLLVDNDKNSHWYRGWKMSKNEWCGPFHLLNPDGNCEHYLVLLDEDSMDEKWSHCNGFHPPPSSSSSSSLLFFCCSVHMGALLFHSNRSSRWRLTQLMLSLFTFDHPCVPCPSADYKLRTLSACMQKGCV